MIQKYSRYRILEKFFDYPRKNFHIRELSRMTKITQLALTLHLKALLEAGFVVKEKTGIYPTFRANRDSESFKLYRRFNVVSRISESGLLDYVYDKCMPNAIILFGSASKGDDIENSDIDLFIQAPEKKLNLEKYEKLLNRKISLFFEENFFKLNAELKNNILNGMVVKGYIKVF